MCGIAGYIGRKPADQVLIVALERLKYRGYDSAGIAVQHDGELLTRRAVGKLKALSDLVTAQPAPGHCGIGHTRWATHGAPTVANCHPHAGGAGRIAVVHNGIIENHEALRRDLKEQGCVFASETDTEVIPHLLARLDTGDGLAAVRATVAQLEGAFAFAAVFADRPDRIICARRGSLLIVGRSRPDEHGKRELLIASDVPALLPHAYEAWHLDDGQLVELHDGTVTACTVDGTPVAPAFHRIEVTAEAVDKGSYDSFMAKEIAEQPTVVGEAIGSHENTPPPVGCPVAVDT